MAQASLKQVNRLLELIVESGWTREELQRRLIERWGLLRQIAEALDDPRLSEENVRAMHPLFYSKKSADPTFKVEVDYGLTLAQMISAGRYDWTNDDINAQNFPIQGEGKAECELVLVHLGKVATTDEVLAELDRRGLRPAKIEELLALGATRPELQKEFPIMALGSRFVLQDGDRGFAYLDWDGSERGLDLHWVGNDWRGIYRFLAVRK